MNDTINLCLAETHKHVRKVQKYINLFVSDLIKRGENHDNSVRIAGDMTRSFAIPEEKRCNRCDGTGNELLSMYKQCQACGGDGVSRGNEGSFLD